MDMTVTLGEILILVGIIIWDIARSFAIVHYTAKKVQKDLDKKNAGGNSVR